MGADMEPELAIVVAEVTKQIQKTVARTQQTAAKKKSAKKKPAKKKVAKKPKKAKKKKKAVKKPKKKKKKKAKKKKKKKKKKAKKNARKQKAAGKGIFKVRTCSAALAAITGKTKMTSGQIVKAVWAYIKAKKLNNKRNITPDAALGKVIGGKTTMFKMNKALFKHVK